MIYPTGKAFLSRLSLDLEKPPACAVDGRSARRERLFGTSLSYLFQVATCHPSCHGGDHVLEALAGRCFNHSLGAAKLIELHLYDEALNLTRSIAEITNLMFLFNARPEILATWKSANRKERLREFSPAKIREKLKRNDWQDLPVSEEAYQELCEIATHATPETKPNRHDPDLERNGLVGGVYDEIGFKKSSNTLLLYCSLSSMVTCNIFGMRDRLKELGEIGENAFYDEPYKKSPPLPPR